MDRKFIILAVILLLAAGWFLMPGGEDQQDAVAERLKQQSRASAPQAVDAPGAKQAPEIKWADLEEQGKGVALPETLVIDLDPEADTWIVRHPEDDVAVEIPYGVGRYRDKPSEEPPTKENPGFVGAEACARCHQERHQGFIHTAHAKTSRLASPDAVTGPLEGPESRLRTAHPYVSFDMFARGDRTYQRVNFLGWQMEVPADIVMGSAKMGESYLYWHHDRLYQMNVTYLTNMQRWINSPGYVDGDAAYARPIETRCVDCHFTYMDYREWPNHYTPSSVITGISCERCHGPGRDHIAFHDANPDMKVGKHITNPTDLNRQQRLDLCAQCHSTVTPMKTPHPFSFRPGDSVSDHYETPDPEKEGGGVHTSNQIARLRMSECFLQSEMSCFECHNPHQAERGNRKLFSERCMSCHQSVADCALHDQPEAEMAGNLADNCVDCHMPLRSTDNFRFETAEGKVFPPLRDHYIRVDAEATRSYLERLIRQSDR